MSVSVKITDGATPALKEMAERLSPRRLGAAIGPAVARLVQRDLRKNGRNKKGWPTTNFWARAAKATNWQATDTGATISVNQIGVAQRYYGGTISAVKKKFLAIPISPVSYGHLPSDFPGLFLMVTKKGAYLVQYGSGAPLKRAKGEKDRNGARGGNAKRRRTGTMVFLFKLVKSVSQKGNPAVIPSEKEIVDTAYKAVEAALKVGGSR